MTATQTGNVLQEWKPSTTTVPTLDNPFVRNLQIQWYPDYYYPQREVVPSPQYYDELIPNTACQTIQPPQLIELPYLNLTLNDTKSISAITPTSFPQCQSMGAIVTSVVF
jgi:hypothetical protein